MSEKKQIFVSHSQNDTDIVTSFDKVFARTGVKSVCMEFEQLNSPEWLEIRNEISQSEAVFLLLGPNIRSSIYTQNWISFEVGLACAYSKKVWVFEQINSKIEFPIPYVTDYMTYNLQDKTHFEYVRSIIEGYGERKYFLPVGYKIHEIPIGTNVECSHCHSKFAMHPKPLAVSYCPSCRQLNIKLIAVK